MFSQIKFAQKQFKNLIFRFLYTDMPLSCKEKLKNKTIVL